MEFQYPDQVCQGYRRIRQGRRSAPVMQVMIFALFTAFSLPLWIYRNVLLSTPNFKFILLVLFSLHGAKVALVFLSYFLGYVIVLFWPALLSFQFVRLANIFHSSLHILFRWANSPTIGCHPGRPAPCIPKFMS